MIWPTKKLGELKLKQVRDLISLLERPYKKLAKDNKHILAVQKFNELLTRLESRFLTLLGVEAEIFNAEPDQLKRPMSDVQLDLVDKVESFYQQLYACVSALSMLLNHIAPHSLRRNMPIGEIKKFLEFLASKYPRLEEQIAWLEKAREFRACSIDHIQQHVLHDWMTYSYPGKFGPECVIIYFLRRGPEVYYRGVQLDPYASNFQPPVNYESFYINPPHKECFLAFQITIESIISDMAANYEE